jgi:hypothetical protein
MTQLYVIPESDTNKARYAIPAYQDKNGEYSIAGSDAPAPSIDIGHLRLNEGSAFALGVVRDFDNPLPDGESIDIAIAFPAGVTPNISIFGLCAGDAMGYLYEGASVTGGTSITPVQKNRSVVTASQGVALYNPTVLSLGTKILEQILIGGTGKKAGGGSTGSSDLILKPLTTYLFRLSNVNGTAHAAEIILEWYE